MVRRKTALVTATISSMELHHEHSFSSLALPHEEPVPPTSTKPKRYKFLTEARVQGTLAVCVLTLGLLTMIWTTFIIIYAYSPVTHWDQWSVVATLIADQGHLKLSRLWEQHNEHRIPFGRIATYIDLRYFGGKNVFLLVLIYLIQLLHLFVFAQVIRRFGRFTLPILGTALGVLLYCMFSPIQMENFIWGFQAAFVMAGAGASVAFASAVRYSENPGDRSSFFPLGFCIFAAFVAELNLANGVFVWPVLSVLAYALRFPRRIQWLLAGIGVFAISIYLYGYKTPAAHSNPLETIQHPFTIFRYVITYLASSWDSSLPNTSLWPKVSESLTIAAIAIALYRIASLVLRRPIIDRLEAFLLSNVAFVLITATITGLGRIKFPFLTESRYQSVALVFWASFALLLLLWTARVVRNEIWVKPIQVVFVLIMLQGISHFASYEQHAKQRQVDLARAYAALAQNSANRELLRPLFPIPEVLPAWYAFMRSHRWGPDPRDYKGIDEFIQPAMSKPKIKGYQLAPTEYCLGFLDNAMQVPDRPGKIDMAGWAWDATAGAPPVKIVLALADGTVAGTANVGISRPDVVKAMPQVKTQDVGWKGTVALSAGMTFRAFAILKDEKSACPLLNELSTR